MNVAGQGESTAIEVVEGILNVDEEAPGSGLRGERAPWSVAHIAPCDTW